MSGRAKVVCPRLLRPKNIEGGCDVILITDRQHYAASRAHRTRGHEKRSDQAGSSKGSVLLQSSGGSGGCKKANRSMVELRKVEDKHRLRTTREARETGETLHFLCGGADSASKLPAAEALPQIPRPTNKTAAGRGMCVCVCVHACTCDRCE